MRRGQGVRKPRRGPGARPATSTGKVFRYSPRPPVNRATLGYFLERVSAQTVNCPLPRMVFWRALEAPFPGFLDGWRPARESPKGNGAEATRSRFLYLCAL